MNLDFSDSELLEVYTTSSQPIIEPLLVGSDNISVIE